MTRLTVTLSPPAVAPTASRDQVLEDVRAFVQEMTGCAAKGAWDGEQIVLTLVAETQRDRARALAALERMA